MMAAYVLAWMVLFVTALAGPATEPAVAGSPDAESAVVLQPDPGRFEKAIQRFEAWDSKNAVPKHAVLFVGSSSIRMWATRESFPDLPLINRGFGGAHISDVNYFAERIVLPYAPEVIVFYAGDNDIADKKTPQRVLADYRAFIELVHRRFPTTRVVFIAIKPSRSRWSFWPQMKAANALVEEHSRSDDRLFYADIVAPMLGSDGKPRVELFLKDALHLNKAGYELWTGILKPLIQNARQLGS